MSRVLMHWSVRWLGLALAIWIAVLPVVTRVYETNSIVTHAVLVSTEESAAAETSDEREPVLRVELDLEAVRSGMMTLLTSAVPKPVFANILLSTGIMMLQADPGSATLLLTAGGAAAADGPLPIGDIVAVVLVVWAVVLWFNSAPAREVDWSRGSYWRPTADITVEEAIDIVQGGGDVVARDQDTAKKIAEEAGDGPPIMEGPHNPGEKPHYHPTRGGERAPGHVWW